MRPEMRVSIIAGSHIRCRFTVTCGASTVNWLIRCEAKTGATGGVMPSRTVPASPAATRRTRGVCCGDLVEDDLRPGQQFGSGVGHRDLAGGAGEQQRAHVALQAPDQLADRRGGHVQALGGPAEMKLGGDGHERFQPAELHNMTVPREIEVPIRETPARELDCSPGPKSA
jgi:hypothetical protein